MTVGELKKALSHAPDDYEVYWYNDGYFENTAVVAMNISDTEVVITETDDILKEYPYTKLNDGKL